MGFGDAVASAGPYGNNLHLAADRYSQQHLITRILTGQMLLLKPDHVKALKALCSNQ